MSDEPKANKPVRKPQTWKRFLWIFGAFVVALAVTIVTSNHDKGYATRMASSHPIRFRDRFFGSSLMPSGRACV
jgi:hypothetical protein